jgi:predicted transcriptional regulator YheO
MDTQNDLKSQPILFDLLKRLADGIVAVFGDHCEVVIHDFRDLSHTVVYIAGNLTGRSPGAPAPFWKEEINDFKPDELNYLATKGSKTLKCSTIWIRNTSGNSIGAVCINVDYSELIWAKEILEKMISSANDISQLVVNNTFARDVDELIDLSLKSFLEEAHIPNITAITQEDKRRVVRSFDEKGIFNIRGAAQKVANVLNLSRASIYNYRSSQKIGEPITADEAPKMETVNK